MTRHLLFCFVLLIAVSANLSAATGNDPAATLEGRWSAPSLSQPNVRIIFSLLPGGKATEQVGSYHGTGTWKLENDSARIQWGSGWIGLLRPAKNGGYELLTWKTKTSPTAPPDDTQLAIHQ